MGPFDYRDEAVRPTRNTSSMVWNILTIIVILMALCLAAIFILVFINLQVSFNPFPPPTLPVLASFPTATPTPLIQLPPTWTPTASPEPTITSTPSPSPAATLEPALATPNRTITPGEGMPFVLHENNPVAIPNIGHPELGCDWMGVAGQVFDLSGAPISGQQVRIGGFLGGKAVYMLTLSGLTSSYGTAGFYEFTLGEELRRESRQII